MSRARCKLATVIERKGCTVQICCHGILHLTLGAVTLRLAGDALEPLAATLAAAASELQRADAATRGASLH